MRNNNAGLVTKQFISRAVRWSSRAVLFGSYRDQQGTVMIEILWSRYMAPTNGAITRPAQIDEKLKVSRKANMDYNYV